MKELFENWKRFLNEDSDSVETLVTKKFNAEVHDLIKIYIDGFAKDFIKKSPALNQINFVENIKAQGYYGDEDSTRGVYLARSKFYVLSALEDSGQAGLQVKEYLADQEEFKNLGLFSASPSGEIFVDVKSKRKYAIEIMKGLIKVFKKQYSGKDPSPKLTQSLLQMSVEVAAASLASTVVHEVVHKVDFESESSPTKRLFDHYHKNMRTQLQQIVDSSTTKFSDDELTAVSMNIMQLSNNIINQVQYQAEKYAYDIQIEFLNKIKNHFQEKKYYHPYGANEITRIIKNINKTKKYALSQIDKKAGLTSNKKQGAKPKQNRRRSSSRSTRSRRPAAVQRRLDIMDRI